MPLVELQDISKSYTMGEVDIPALRNVSLTIDKGNLVTFVGPSGSGKTTLLNIIGCMDKPTAGASFVNETRTDTLNRKEAAQFRGEHLGFIFQSFYLIPYATALENVILPGLYSGKPRVELQARAEFLLEQVGLSDRMDFRPSRLSGGQQQRVAMARAMLNEPDIVLADEPTGQLDSTTSTEIMKLFHTVHEAGQTIILVTHDEDVAGEAGRIIRLSDGVIVDDVRGEK